MARSRLTFGTIGAAAIILAGCATPHHNTSDQAISKTLWEMATTAEKSYDYATAVGHYHQITVREPDNVDAQAGLARNLRYAGDPKEAIKDLKTAIAKMGEKQALVLELGKSQLAASIVNDARETLEKYADKYPDDWQAHAVLALVYDRLERHGDAQTQYKEALKLSPGNIDITNNLALSYAITGELDTAIAMLKKVVDSENVTPQTRQNLALLYAMDGDMDTARRLSSEDLTPEQVARNIAAYRLLRGDPAAPTGSAKSKK